MTDGTEAEQPVVRTFRGGALGALVTEGLYRVSRDPVFAGQRLLLAGVALAVPSVPTALAVVLFWGSAQAQIRTEEDLLEQRHGEVYRAYQIRVPRWVGWGQGGLIRHRRSWRAP